MVRLVLKWGTRPQSHLSSAYPTTQRGNATASTLFFCLPNDTGGRDHTFLLLIQRYRGVRGRNHIFLLFIQQHEGKRGRDHIFLLFIQERRGNAPTPFFCLFSDTRESAAAPSANPVHLCPITTRPQNSNSQWLVVKILLANLMLSRWNRCSKLRA